MLDTFEPPKELIIDSEVYSLVKTRTYDPISIYEGRDTFLRIGLPEKLRSEAQFHRKLYSLGFPVPEIISSGEYQGQYYYIEQAFSGQVFGKLFAEECATQGVISDESFTHFLEFIEKYADAQLKTVVKMDWSDSFHQMAQFDFLHQERPGLTEQLNSAYEKVKKRLIHLPAVLTHEDFNPYNLFPQGIIDIGDFAYAPAGYDVAMNIFHTYMFPAEGDYELYRRFSFTSDQYAAYFSHLDRLFTRQSLPNPSDHIDDFLVCKMTWSAARLGHKPKLQALRYQLLEEITTAYLADRPVKELLLVR